MIFQILAQGKVLLTSNPGGFLKFNFYFFPGGSEIQSDLKPLTKQQLIKEWCVDPYESLTPFLGGP